MKQQWPQASDKNKNILSDYIPSFERNYFFFDIKSFICPTNAQLNCFKC